MDTINKYAYGVSHHVRMGCIKYVSCPVRSSFSDIPKGASTKYFGPAWQTFSAKGGGGQSLSAKDSPTFQ